MIFGRHSVLKRGCSTWDPALVPQGEFQARLDGVRREMARVYRAMKARTIDTQDGTRLVYVLTQIAKLHEIVEIERRIDELERLSSERQ